MNTSLLVAAVIGALSGTHTAIWGMYKDAVHEGFSRARFSRSIIIGVCCAMSIQLVLALPFTAGSVVLLFGLAYAAERGIVEVWKTFVREEDQSKYFIPMQFSIRGQPVQSRALRLLAGVAYVTIVGFSLWGIHLMDRAGAPNGVSVVLVGLVPGLIIAVGGGWKDAPKEGFDPLKFMRSPAMTVTYALLLSQFTDSRLLMAVSAIGFERATAETYKTFFFPSKPRGKFSGKPVTHPHMLRDRLYFVPVYVAIWVAVVLSGVIALREPVVRLASGGVL